MKSLSAIEQLIHKGVEISNPQSVEIGEEVCLDRIAGNEVKIYSGSRIYGKETLICEGARIGQEGPATVVDCYVGPHVKLKGGFFQEAAFLKGASCGSGAHVRQGTILEEQSSIAHTVGLKQTILFPYVTLGSLINFCDCLMAGGTGRDNHSEVGSSYIHFNFTPNQDKATPSLIGDVPRGVMLNQSPIFLGGQGGLVGPCRLAYGTVTAAGTVCRKDQLDENFLVIENGPKSARLPFKPGGYRNLKRILDLNLNYIANLMALGQWYRHVRSRCIGPDFPGELATGLSVTLDKAIAERINQLEKLKNKVEVDHPKAEGLENRFCVRWPEITARLQELKGYEGTEEPRDRFLNLVEQGIQRNGRDYLNVIQALEDDQAAVGSQWLQSIVDHVAATTLQLVL